MDKFCVVQMCKLGVLVRVSVMLTKGHPATDDLGALLHICDSSYWKTPVCHWAPEMLHTNTNTTKLELRPYT